jgi:exosome complex component RRP4
MEKKINVVTPGDLLATTHKNMAGAGTYEDGEEIYASFAGIVTKIGRLIMVKPLKRKYNPGVGDVVIGRIMSIDHGRWKIDINSYQHANLLLTAINLPGGEQRRRSEKDKNIMREYYKENDIISAEVQSLNSHDSAIFLQTRNMKYGKLVNGFYLKVNHNLIKRMKNHYLNTSEQNVSLILGNNGYIWIYYNPHSSEKGKEKETDMIESLIRGEQHILNIQTAIEIPKSARLGMAKVRNCLIILDKLNMPIFEYSINKSLEIVKEHSEPFSLLSDSTVIAEIQEAIKEYIKENHLNDINNLLDEGVMEVDNDFV